MTWTTAISTGDAEFGLWLEIVGFGVFGSVKHTPSDSWCNEYSSAGRVYPWLVWDSIDGWREEIDFLEADLKVTGIAPRIVDVDGGMTALFSNYRAGTYTRLTATLTSAATTVSVDTTNGFSSAGLIWIGSECIEYSTTSTGVFQGCDRGHLGTQAIDHLYDVSVLPPRKPVVADNVATLTGKRAYLHFATYDSLNDSYSATQVVYRGRVQKGSRVKGGVYTIPVEHISSCMKQKVGRGLGEARLSPRRYVFADVPSSKRYARFIAQNTAGTTTIATNVYIDALQYDEMSLLFELSAKWRTAFASYTGQGWYPWLTVSDDKVVVRTGTSGGWQCTLSVSKHDPLWCLGFEAGISSQNVDNEGLEVEAEGKPKALQIETQGQWTLDVDEPGQVVKLSSGVVYLPVAGSPWLRVHSTGADSIKLSASGAAEPENLGREVSHIVVDDEKSLVLRDAFRVYGQVDNVMKQCFGLADNIFTSTSRYEAAGALSTDFDFTELASAFAGAGRPLYVHKHLVTAEVEVQKLVSPTLAIIGACPRITDDAKIGFASIRAPTELETNEVEVDDDTWANIQAAEIESRLNATPLVNVVSVGINQDFQQKNEAFDEVNCFNIDGLNELGETKRIRYEAMIKKTWTVKTADIVERLNERFVALHFPLFGRESATVEVPCNWRAKNIKCGDLVKITHGLIYDTPRGTLGVTDAMALVVGRKLAIAAGNDILRLRIFTGNPWKAVAPTAKATSFDEGSAFVQCTSIQEYCLPGETDFTGFLTTTPLEVVLRPFNVAGSTVYPATLTSVNASLKRLYFSSAPFTSGDFPSTGMWVMFANWDSRTSSVADGYAYQADASTAPVLGTSADVPHRWGP